MSASPRNAKPSACGTVSASGGDAAGRPVEPYGGPGVWSTRPVSIVNEDDIEWVTTERGTVFENRCRRLAAAAGSEDLGCSLTEVPPGKTAWPFHAHLGNEEAIYILEGNATLRLGAKQHPLKVGDFVALLPREDAAHQIINTSDAPVRYLAISTMRRTDVIVYPDSKKRGMLVDAAPGCTSRDFAAFVPDEAAVAYWDGEQTGEAEARRAAEIEEQVDEQLEALKKRLELK